MSEQIEYSKILHYNFQGSSWAINNEDYDSLEWFSSNTKPTQKELDALWPAVKLLIAAESDASHETPSA